MSLTCTFLWQVAATVHETFFIEDKEARVAARRALLAPEGLTAKKLAIVENIIASTFLARARAAI